MSFRGAVFYIRDATLGAGSAFRSTVVRVCLSCCTVIALVWVAVMMYISFYYAYMPTVRHAEPVYLQFSSECGYGLCSYPEANVSLSKGERILMRGQKYQVFLDLEMPHSPVNEKLGMFMVNIKFLSRSGSIVAKSSRSCMLHYKSSLLQTFYTVFMFVPMMFGLTEEKQHVPVQLFENYIDDSYHPAVSINVAIKAKHIEIYTASLRIEAQFTGLRYILFNWPVTAALVIVSANFIVMSFIFFFAYTAFIPEPEEELFLTTAQEQPLATQPSPSNARRRNVESPQASRHRLPIRNGRSKPKSIHKRERLKPDIRNGVPSSRRDTETDTDGMLRSATFPPFRWESPECPERPGPSGPHSDTAVYSASGAVGGGDSSDPGGLPVGGVEDLAHVSGGVTKDHRDVRGQELLPAHPGLAGGKHRASKLTKHDTNQHKTTKASMSLTDATSLPNQTHDGIPLRTRSDESGVRAHGSRGVYTIIDPGTGTRYQSYADYSKSRQGNRGKSFKIGNTDVSEEERTLTSDGRDGVPSQDKEARLGSQRPLSYRVPDGAPSGSTSSLNGPASASEERAELSNGTLLTQRSTKRSRHKIGLSFRKMLSLK